MKTRSSSFQYEQKQCICNGVIPSQHGQCCRPGECEYSKFSQMHDIGYSGNIAICVFPYICSFLFYSNGIILVNTKLDITGYKRITYQDWLLQWSSKFQMAQLRHKWQYCHCCIMESLWKLRLSKFDFRHFLFCFALLLGIGNVAENILSVSNFWSSSNW